MNNCFCISEYKSIYFKKDNLKGELDLPESIKNNYTAIVRNRLFKDETINFYERDDKNNTVIAFEDRKDSINTSRSDEKTIKAMLDIAVSKNWASVSLKGTEEFKQKTLEDLEKQKYSAFEAEELDETFKAEVREWLKTEGIYHFDFYRHRRNTTRYFIAFQEAEISEKRFERYP